MQFSVNKNDFLSQLQKVAKATTTRTPNPILSHILIKLEDDNLTLRATDLEITMMATVKANGITNGIVAVPARLLIDIIEKIDEEEITIKTIDSYETVIKTNKGEYSFNTKPGDEFPELPIIKDIWEFNIKRKVLFRLIDKTIFAVSKDELKPALTGVLFQIRNDEIRSVATDGHRLICLKRKDVVSPDITKDVIIPTKFLSLLLPYLEDESEIKVIISENHAKVDVDNITIFTRLINERFPDYESVIPYDNDKILKVAQGEILSSLKRMAVFANKNTHQISIDLKSDEIIIKAFDYENRNMAQEKLFGEYSGTDLLIGFNVDYLRELIRNLDSTNVIIKFKTPLSACVIVPEVQEENEELLSLLMPIRLTEQ
ncbi:MAG: DNA polymerase III subunit beta [Candidatus Jordarchaeaceae archaeon]